MSVVIGKQVLSYSDEVRLNILLADNSNDSLNNNFTSDVKQDFTTTCKNLILI